MAIRFLRMPVVLARALNKSDDKIHRSLLRCNLPRVESLN